MADKSQPGPETLLTVANPAHSLVMTLQREDGTGLASVTEACPSRVASQPNERVVVAAPFREDIKARQVVEHRQARMIQFGGRPARYFGGIKSKYQAYMVAIVANLTRMVGAICLFSPNPLIVASLERRLPLPFRPGRPPCRAEITWGREMTPGLRLASWLPSKLKRVPGA